MKIIGKIQTFAKMMPVIEKDQLPNENEPISVKEIIKQDGLVKFLIPKEPIKLNENELKFRGVCTIENGEKNYKKINRKYRVKKAVIELLERYPCFWFTNEPWVIKALKEKPVKSGRKRRGRALIKALVDALKENGYKENRAFRILPTRIKIGIGYERIRDLYYDAKKNLIDKPFTVSSISKSIGKHESTDLVEYTFIFIKPGVKIGLEEAKAIMSQIG